MQTNLSLLLRLLLNSEQKLLFKHQYERAPVSKSITSSEDDETSLQMEDHEFDNIAAR